MSKIGIISDIHFGQFSRTKEFSVPGENDHIIEVVNGKSLRNGLIERLKENKVEYLFIPGDLTSIGSPQEFELVENEILSIAKECGVDKNNIIVTLGNHDVDRKIHALAASHENDDDGMKKIIKNGYLRIASNGPRFYMSELIKNLKSNELESFSGVFEGKDFIQFVLNSGSECSIDEKYGKLKKHQLEWIEGMLKEHIDNKKWKIIMVHHHVYDYPYPVPSRDTSKLSESAELREIAGLYGANLVIHGHRHHPRAKTVCESHWKNNVTFICAGSLSVNENHRSKGEIPNTFHIISLENDFEMELLTFQYTSAQGWIENKFTKNSPVDHIMKLGKLYDDSIIEEKIKSLPLEVEIPYEKLPKELKFLLEHEINNRLKKTFGNKLIGKVPDVIFIRGDKI